MSEATIGLAIHVLIEAAVIVRVLLRPHCEPASRIAWIVVVAALPLLGIVLYLLFGEVNIGRRRVARSGYDEQGLPLEKGCFWYGFWPQDTHIIKKICDDHGTGTSISVFEPGWMKNVINMARSGGLPRGSKLNIYFAPDGMSSMAPPIPEALELYIKMMEGLDLKWSVGAIGAKSVMDTPLARMALERGGSFRVGLEDWASGPSNLEQIKRAKEIIDAVGRPVATGADAIKYLDIPYAKTRPSA